MPAPHGTRSRYVKQKCRCALCKDANRRYYHERQAAKKAAALALEVAPASGGVEQVWTAPSGEKKVRTYRRRCPGPPGRECPTRSHLRKDSIGGICSGCRMLLDRAEDRLVSAARARDHIEGLTQAGVGYKSIADAADVASTTVVDIWKGRHKRIQSETERKLLEVDVEAMAGGIRVSSGPTQEAIRELLRLGLTKGDIAVALGSKSRALQVGRRPQVTLETQHRVQRLLRVCKREQERHRALVGGLCEQCGNDHGVERVAMLERLPELTWESAREVYGCVYPDNALARRRFDQDVRVFRAEASRGRGRGRR